MQKSDVGIKVVTNGWEEGLKLIFLNRTKLQPAINCPVTCNNLF